MVVGCALGGGSGCEDCDDEGDGEDGLGAVVSVYWWLVWRVLVDHGGLGCGGCGVVSAWLWDS